MPGLLQKIVAVNPVSHLVNASRGPMNGDGAASDVVWVLVASAVITAVFAPFALPGGAPENVSSDLGRVVWRDGEFLVLLGRQPFLITR